MVERVSRDLFSVNTSAVIDGVSSYEVYRGEHSRSLEQRERQVAIETLVRLGLFKKMSNSDAYHGRAVASADRNGGVWRVYPEFSNGSNDTCSGNFNGMSALYTANRKLAAEYAMARAKRLGGSALAETHRIVSLDPDAVIIKPIDVKVNRAEVIGAVQSLMPELLDGVFSVDDQRRSMHITMAERASNIVSKSPHLVEWREYKDEPDCIKKIINRRNARHLLLDDPYEIIQIALLGGSNVLSGKGYEQIVIDKDFIAEFAKNAHIIGAEQRVRSGTLGGKAMDMDTMFDLYAIDSADSDKLRRLAYEKHFSEIANELGDRLSHIENQEFCRVLSEPYSTPKQLMEAAIKAGGEYYENLFAMDAGNWEGYTLGEHTETVLDNLENNFADKLPVGILSAMRLILITHDIGKSVAVKEGCKDRQDDYNDFYARDFLDNVGGLDKNTIDFIVNMRKSIDLMSRVYFDKYRSVNPASDSDIQDFMIDRIGEIGLRPSRELERGCSYIAKCLLICDGGAYTSRARTRRGSSVYVNYPAFDETFPELKNDLTKRRLAY